MWLPLELDPGTMCLIREAEEDMPQLSLRGVCVSHSSVPPLALETATWDELADALLGLVGAQSRGVWVCVAHLPQG